MMRHGAKRVALVTMFSSWTACGTPAAETPASPGPAPTERPADPAPHGSSSASSDDPRYYGDAELVALGFRIAPQSARPTREHIGPDGPAPTIDGYSFVCGDGTSGEGCVCRRELPCTARGDCETVVREELICGEDSVPVATPLDDLRRFAAQGR